MATKIKKTGSLLGVFRGKMETLKKQLENDAIRAGQKAVDYARSETRPRYEDQTGNLTSSIGYAVTENGKVIQTSAFEKAKDTATDGGQKGRELATKDPENVGISLVLVAGMEYADCVEHMGLDVLDSASILAKQELKKLVNNTLMRNTKKG